MNVDETAAGRGVGRVAPPAIASVGVVLVGIGVYMNRSIAGRARCDGCEPWHPLFVLAPMLLGTVLVAAGWLAARRFG